MKNDKFMPLVAMAAHMAVQEVIACNMITARYGLVLSPAEARELAETQALALSGSGRIDFAGGILRKLVLKFCDSPYLAQFNYASTLHDLVETFYYFKNETMDEMDDDELLELMKRYFDQNCRGSVELLQGRELENLARSVRCGVRAEADAAAEEEEEDE